MKKALLFSLFMAGSSATLLAQSTENRSSTTATVNVQMQISDPPPPERAKAETELMTKSLGLNEAQQAKVFEVNLSAETELLHIRNAGASASPDRKTAIQKNRDDQFKTILTAEQFAKYEATKQ